MKKFFNVKTISLILAVILLVGGAVGGTLAWIIDTKTVTNTFTYGDIDIKLDEAKTDKDGTPLDKEDNVVDLDQAHRIETGNEYEMIPGSTYTKDPTVTVLENSEPCWLFVQVTEKGKGIDASTDPVTEYGFDKYLAYEIASVWTKYTDGVYYIEIKNVTTADTKYPVLEDNKITVNENVTKAMLNALDATGAIKPTLEVTAYAIQRANIDTVEEAWQAITASNS